MLWPLFVIKRLVSWWVVWGFTRNIQGSGKGWLPVFNWILDCLFWFSVANDGKNEFSIITQLLYCIYRLFHFSLQPKVAIPSAFRRTFTSGWFTIIDCTVAVTWLLQSTAKRSTQSLAVIQTTVQLFGGSLAVEWK